MSTNTVYWHVYMSQQTSTVTVGYICDSTLYCELQTRQYIYQPYSFNTVHNIHREDTHRTQYTVHSTASVSIGHSTQYSIILCFYCLIQWLTSIQGTRESLRWCHPCQLQIIGFSVVWLMPGVYKFLSRILIIPKVTPVSNMLFLLAILKSTLSVDKTPWDPAIFWVM